MKKYFIILLLLHFLVFYSSAQQKYYEIIATVTKDANQEIEYFEHLKSRFENRTFHHDGYTIFFQNSPNGDRTEENFDFSEVQIMDTHTNRFYVKRNYAKKKSYEDITDELQKYLVSNSPIPTGQSATINGYYCDEYKYELPVLESGSIYLTQELPNIKHLPVIIDAPGFAVQMEFYAGNNQKINVQYQLEEVENNPIYFKYLDEVKSQYPRPIVYTEVSYTNDKILPKNQLDKINSFRTGNLFFHNSIKDFSRKNNRKDSIELIIEQHYATILSYYNSKGEITHRLNTGTDEVIICNYNEKGELIDGYENGKHLYKVDSDTLITYSYGKVSNKKVFKESKNQLEEYIGENKYVSRYNKHDKILRKEIIKPDYTTNEIYNYNKNKVLESHTSTKTQAGEPDVVEKNNIYEYYSSGLIKTKITMDDTTNYNYIIKDKFNSDTIIVISNSGEKDQIDTYVFEDSKFLLSGYLLDAKFLMHEENVLEEEYSLLQHQLLTFYLGEYIHAKSIAKNPPDSYYSRSVESITRYPFLIYYLVDQYMRDAPFKGLTIYPRIKAHSLLKIKEDAEANYFKVYYKEKILGIVDIDEVDFEELINGSIQFVSPSYIEEIDHENYEIQWSNESNFVIAKQDKKTNKWQIIR